MPAQARGGLAVAVALTLAAPAFAQWTDAGGGDHGGWDYTPAGGATIGGTHVNVYNFNTIEGRNHQDRRRWTRDGDLGGASRAFGRTDRCARAGPCPRMRCRLRSGHVAVASRACISGHGRPAGTVGPGGTVGGLVLTKTGLTAS
jgi:hypothetical protein